MPPEQSSDSKFEIGHVLFVDIVGYSKRLINEQRVLVETLGQIVRNTDKAREAKAAGRLKIIATGDGMALVFYTSPEAPVECALEIARADTEHMELELRMGIHSGPVSEVVDVNESANVAGAGINMAQRVMDCGDAGHILLSRRIAEDLEQFAHWRPFLHELGECEVKHGVRVHLTNLYTEDLGNRELPKKFLLLKKQSTRLRRTALTAAVLALAIVVTGIVIFSRFHVRSPRSAPAGSVAVLPFDNLSRDPENAYFSEGIQDEILTRLAKIAELKVISRTSTERFKSSPDDLPRIAEQLGVANILEGSVQKPSDQVRVNVQLIHAASDTHLWAETYDRKLTDVFAVESDIAKAIAENLQAKLTGSAEHVLASRPTEDPEAHEFYLKGRYFWNKRNPENLKKAIDYFKRAIAQDPAYALAYSGLADAHAVFPYYASTPPKDDAKEALVAARKAVQLDDSLSEAHTSLANALVLNMRSSASLPEFQRAIELNANYATAHHWYGEALQNEGRFDEGVAELKRAQDLDPLSLVINCVVGSTLIVAGRNDEAIEQLRKTIEMDPAFDLTHWFLGQAYEDKGQIADAIAQYEKATRLNPDPAALASLARAYALAGRKEEARKILDDLTVASRERYVSAYALAVIHLSLGDRSEALRLLEQGERDGAPFDTGVFGSIKIDRRLDSLRGDPRFEKLVGRIESPKPEE